MLKRSGRKRLPNEEDIIESTQRNQERRYRRRREVLEGLLYEYATNRRLKLQPYPKENSLWITIPTGERMPNVDTYKKWLDEPEIIEYFRAASQKPELRMNRALKRVSHLESFMIGLRGTMLRAHYFRLVKLWSAPLERNFTMHIACTMEALTKASSASYNKNIIMETYLNGKESY